MAAANSPTFEDLLDACEWVSADASGENAAYVSRATGRVYWCTDAVDPEEAPPEDVDDGTQYLAVPHKRDLGIGVPLALRFVDEVLPSRYREASEFFQYPGAYRRFKAMLETTRKLDGWYAYESAALVSGLRAWAIENALPIPAPSQPGEV